MNGDLFDYIRRDAPAPSFDKILRIMLDISSGLDYLHSRTPKIIHRDMKRFAFRIALVLVLCLTSLLRISSSNVLITGRGVAKITDFVRDSFPLLCLFLPLPLTDYLGSCSREELDSIDDQESRWDCELKQKNSGYVCTDNRLVRCTGRHPSCGTGSLAIARRLTATQLAWYFGNACNGICQRRSA